MSTKLILCFLLLFNIYACEGIVRGARIFSPSQTENGHPVTNEYRVKVGEDFALKFKSNPSTGYVWKFANQMDVTNVRLLDTKTLEFNNPSNLQILGRGGYTYFYLRVLEKPNDGEPITLKFVYEQYWSVSDKIPDNTIKITVE